MSNFAKRTGGPLDLPQWSEEVYQFGDLNQALATINAYAAASGLAGNHLYPGADLTVQFAAEIAAAPYSGDPWAWIRARIRAADYTGLRIGDYIPFTAGGYSVKAEIAGIDTYYRYGDTAVGHHIDFISRDCWPVAHAYNQVKYNNGTSASPSPWLASDLYAWLNSLAMQVPNSTAANPAMVAVDYRTTGVYDKLPAAMQAVIATKRALLPSRYTAGSLLTDDNAWTWADAGKLWIPSEMEVCGCAHRGSRNGYASGGFVQYPIFAANMRRVKGAGDGGARTRWWLLSAIGGGSDVYACVDRGTSVDAYADNATVNVPLCFRVA